METSVQPVGEDTPDRAEVDTPPEDAGAVHTWPSVSAPPVYDDDPIPVDTGEPPPTHDDADDGDQILYGDEVQDFYIEMDGVSIAELGADPEDDVPARFQWQDQVWEKVGVHLKGSYSFRDLTAKAAFKIDFGQYVDGDTFRGVRHVTLNNMVQDRSMLHEHVYYWLCQQLGIPAPRHGYARVYVNGELYGLYGVLETMDEAYTARAWPDDPYGNLYEASPADFTWDSDWFTPEVDGGRARVPDDIDDLVDELEFTPPEQQLAALDTHFDRDRLFRYLALDAASGNPDGYVYNRHNYHVYHATTADRWYLSPWGLDQALKGYYLDVHAITGARPVMGALLVECLATPECTSVYDAALREVVDTWEAVDVLGYAEDTWARIEPDCQQDPRRETSCDAQALFDFLAARPDDVRAQLPPL